jgi:hypothetical protein
MAKVQPLDDASIPWFDWNSLASPTMPAIPNDILVPPHINPSNEKEVYAKTLSKIKKEKNTFECGLCHHIFTSSQAMGGHKKGCNLRGSKKGIVWHFKMMPTCQIFDWHLNP